MQTGQSLIKNRIWMQLLPVAIAVVSLLTISSCKEKKEKKKALVTSPSCMMLTKTDINQWVTNGYTDTSAANKNRIIWLRFITSWKGAGTEFDVKVEGLRDDKDRNSIVSGSETKLTSGSSCIISLPAAIGLSSNSCKLSDLNILEPNGTLKSNFDYLLLTPEANPTDPNYMSFKMTVFYTAGSTPEGGTLPCPPCINCKYPCPDDCPLPCPPVPVGDSLK